MTIAEVPTKVVYSRPKSLDDRVTHYCPGCTHGIAHRLVAEVLDEMEIVEDTIGVASVGCSVFSYNYFNVDFVEAAHGRARPWQPASSGSIPITSSSPIRRWRPGLNWHG